MLRNSTLLTTVAGLLSLGAACTPDYNLSEGAPDVDPGLITECDFTPIQGTNLSEYDCNPVFSGTEESWGNEIQSVGFHVTEVLGHPFYQMWYTGVPTGTDTFGGYALGYGVSANGTEWELHDSNPLLTADPNAWDADSMAGQVVVYDDTFGEYLMAYQGFTLGDGVSDPGTWGLGVATSADGVTWTKNAGNPVINFSSMQETSEIVPCWPLTINKTELGYVGWIAATVNDPFGALFGIEYPCEIYSMSSVDRVNWAMSSAPVMSAPASGPDQMGVTSASVVEFDGQLHMFFVGFTDWVQYDGYQSANNTSLMHAVSLDNGASWIRDPQPLTTGNVTPGNMSTVAAQIVGSRIMLWVTDAYPDLNKQAVDYYYYEPNPE